MNKIVRITSLFLLALLLFIPLQKIGASDGTVPGQMFFGQSFTLKSGQTMNGDLVVFGGSATVEENATVNGNVVVFGGSLNIIGTVNKDAVVFGGTAYLGATAHILGNLSTLNSTLDRADGSIVDGQVNSANGGISGQNGIHTPPVPVTPNIHFDFGPLTRILDLFGQAIFMGILAMLVMFFLAPHADRIAHAVMSQPLTTGGVGLLTAAALVVAIPVIYIALALVSVLIITLIVTVPVMIAIPIAIVMAFLFGWIAIGYEVGRRFTAVIHQQWHPAFSAALGTFFLTLIANSFSVLNFIPGFSCITWILPALVALLGLGGVVMTRFGTQNVIAPVKTVAPVAPTSPTPAP